MGQGLSETPNADTAALKAELEQALALDGRSGRATAMLGHNIAIYERRYDDAFVLFDDAIRATPGDAETLLWTGPALTCADHEDDAVDRLMQASRLTLDAPLRFRYDHFLSIAHFASGNIKEGTRVGLVSMARNSRYTLNLRITAGACVATGDMGKARELTTWIMLPEPKFRVSNFVSRQAFRDPARLDDSLTAHVPSSFFTYRREKGRRELFGFVNGGSNAWSNGGSNGGLNGGSAGFSVPADRIGNTAAVLPFDGVVTLEDIDVACLPIGLNFPTASWSPDLRAQLVLGEFDTSGWRKTNPAGTVPLEPWEHSDGFSLAPSPLDHVGSAEAEIAALLEKRDTQRNGERTSEIAWQVDRPADYWTTLLSIDRASKPATMALIACAFTVGQMVGTYFKGFFARARPAHLLPTLMTVVPTPNHPSYPSNHALQNELVALLLLRLLPGSLKNRYSDAINSMAFRLAENREIGGLHFSQDTDAGRKIARWLDKTYLRNLDTMQALLAEAISEWNVNGHSAMRNLPLSEWHFLREPLSGFNKHPKNGGNGVSVRPSFGAVVPDKDAYQADFGVRITRAAPLRLEAEAPISLDEAWRYLWPTRDQFGRGTCAAFGAISAIELLRAGEMDLPPERLSEQFCKNKCRHKFRWLLPNLTRCPMAGHCSGRSSR